MRKVTTALLGLAIVSAGGRALAAGGEFSSRGTVAFGADRLFGLYVARRDLDLNAAPPLNPIPPYPLTQHVDSTEIGLLWQGNQRLTPFTVPRIGVDYFVIDHLSLGGTVGFASTNMNGDVNGADQTGFLFGPRVGFATMFNKWAGIWPRGGITYYTFSGSNDLDYDQLAFTAECMFVLQPAEGFAFLVGPTFDYGLTGHMQAGPYGADLHEHAFGIFSVGLMGWL
jgi:hypothetical protein